MAKAKTKEELVSFSEENWRKMFHLIDTLPLEAQMASFAFGQEKGKEAHWVRDKNIRDVFAHLYEWQVLLQNFVKSNVAGNTQSFLPAPYTWKNYATMNQEIWKKHQSTSYEEIREKLEASHVRTIQLLQQFSDKELYTKEFYSWTGAKSLSQYFQSSLASHYDWALKKLRLHKRTI